MPKKALNYEMRFQRKNGDSAWAMLNFNFLIEDDTGAGRVIEGTFVDITDASGPRRPCTRLNSAIASCSNATSPGSFDYTTEGRVLDANDAYAHILGYRSGEELARLLRQN